MHINFYQKNPHCDGQSNAKDIKGANEIPHIIRFRVDSDHFLVFLEERTHEGLSVLGAHHAQPVLDDSRLSKATQFHVEVPRVRRLLVEGEHSVILIDATLH